MKTKSFLEAMMAAALSFNFMACSDDDEPNGGNGGGSGSGDATKRLTRIYVQAEWDTNNETVFQYDSEGRVTEMDITYDHHSSGDTWTDYYTYSYNGNEVTVDVDYAGDGPEYREQESSTYALNDNGYVTNGVKTTNSGREIQYTFNYTNDYLVSAAIIQENENTSDNISNQIISDGLILPDEWDTIEYTDISNKANFFFHYSGEYDIFDFSTFEYGELYFANLAGKAPIYLPQKVKDRSGNEYNYSYELDDEGYVTEMTITHSKGEQPTIITCTYEDIH